MHHMVVHVPKNMNVEGIQNQEEATKARREAGREARSRNKKRAILPGRTKTRPFQQQISYDIPRQGRTYII